MSLDESKRERISHPFPPLYNKKARILILGSFPSVKSREQKFFYGHPQNRFWKVVAGVLSWPVPETIEEKRKMLLDNHIALWDTIASCDIVGSSDSSIKNAVPNDLSEILDHSEITHIFCNGAKSYEYYRKYTEEKTGRKAVKLPSTSPANAAWSVDRLKGSWRQILGPLRCVPEGTGRSLLAWYDYHARVLPWRSDPTPYHVWISEIMLQQTRVEAVRGYYERWMREIPDVASLAVVDDEKLMKLWEGLGYYNRARNLKVAAKQIIAEHDGRIPETYEKLLTLKGIGDYTAGAIASIAFGQAVPAMDGNVYRVFTRILAEDRDVTKAQVKKDIRQEVCRAMGINLAESRRMNSDTQEKKEELSPESNIPGRFNQALMDLGATVCLPNGEPLCDRCPLAEICQAHRQGVETAFPVKPVKKPRRIEEMGVFLIEAGDHIVLHKRPAGGLLPDLWEFPNASGAFAREKAQQQVKSWGFTDYEVETAAEGKHIFSHVEWHMKGFWVRLGSGSADQLESILKTQEWILANKKEAVDAYAIPGAFRKFRDCVSASAAAEQRKENSR